MIKQGKGTMHASHASRGSSLRVLCAEDHEQLAMALKYALEGAGHVVECVEDGQKALERITSDLRFFDVLVTDHQMPRLSGLRLVEQLRDTTFSGKIIVHSSPLSAADANAYHALSVDHILTKPTELAALLSLVEQLVENTR